MSKCAVLLTVAHCALTDPGHQRAGGNLRYFEKLLAQELRETTKTQKPASEQPIQLDTYERPRDYLPEREIYEALCRGEGVKMVRWFPQPSHLLLLKH